MAKKRKEVKKIIVDYKALQEDRDRPSCFGEKCSYCNPELCGIDWYGICEASKGGVV